MIYFCTISLIPSSLGSNECCFIEFLFSMRVSTIFLVALFFLNLNLPFLLFGQFSGRPLPDTLVVCHKASTPEILGVWEDLPDSLECKWTSQDVPAGRAYSDARIFAERLKPGFYQFTRQVLDSALIVKEDSTVIHIASLPQVTPRQMIIPTCDNSGDGAIRLREYEGKGEIRYSWNSGQNTPDIERLNSGTYEITVTDANNCESKQRFALMSPEPIDIELLVKEDASCGKMNGTAVVKATGGVGEFRYMWNTEEGFEGVGLDGLAPGLYIVKAEDSRGCWDTLQIPIQGLSFRKGKIHSNPTDTVALCVSEAVVTFEAEDRYADQYYWSFGDSTESESMKPSHTFEAPGMYSVVCTMYEIGNDCPAKDSLVFEIQHDGEVIIPELFSPNGDGVNDHFFVRGHLQTLDMQLFNKHGRLVKTLSSPEEKWNGRNEDGRKLSQGEYKYKLKAELSVCKDLEQEGIIKLVR